MSKNIDQNKMKDNIRPNRKPKRNCQKEPVLKKQFESYQQKEAKE